MIIFQVYKVTLKKESLKLEETLNEFVKETGESLQNIKVNMEHNCKDKEATILKRFEG